VTYFLFSHVTQAPSTCFCLEMNTGEFQEAPVHCKRWYKSYYVNEEFFRLFYPMLRVLQTIRKRHTEKPWTKLQTYWPPFSRNYLSKSASLSIVKNRLQIVLVVCVMSPIVIIRFCFSTLGSDVITFLLKEGSERNFPLTRFVQSYIFPSSFWLQTLCSLNITVPVWLQSESCGPTLTLHEAL